MKRLKSRIDALEQNRTADGKLSRAESTSLVNVLGRRDALCWPLRFLLNSQIPFAEIRRRQREYFAGTSGIAVKADGKANWKTAHAMRQKLISRGMITAVHSSGQVQSVFLTAQGEAVARALVATVFTRSTNRVS